MSDRDRREDEISMQINKILSLTKGSALDQAGLSQFDHCPAEEATTEYPRILYEWTFIERYLCRVIESEPGIVHFEQARIERGDPSLMRFERTREPMGAANELIQLNERWMRAMEAEARLREEMIGFMRWDLGDRRGFPKRWDEAWSVVERDWRDPDFMREQMARYRKVCAEFEQRNPDDRKEGA